MAFSLSHAHVTILPLRCFIYIIFSPGLYVLVGGGRLTKGGRLRILTSMGQKVEVHGQN